MSAINENDFFAGMMAALKLQGFDAISLRGGRFDAAMASAADRLRAIAPERGLEMEFRIKPHPVHGSSATLRASISAAVQADIVGLQNPEYQDLQLKIDDGEARRMLQWLPGSEALYKELAEEFDRAYFVESQPA
jgi:hypothetical protein